MKLKLSALTKAIASTLVPEALSANSRSSTFIKIRALAGNTGNVFIGDSASQDFPLAPGAELPLSEISSGSGGSESLDLRDIYCRTATNGNGVAILIAEKP